MIGVTARRLALVATLGAVGSWAAPALAADPAAAQALFDQARKLMLEEKWAAACPKLQESQRLDPAGGTLLHLALCREREGRIATAWTIYLDALSQAKRDGRKDRAKIAQERIDALAPRLPRLKIRVAAQNKATPGFTLSRDEVEVGAAQWDSSFPVDPGTITLSARAPGKKPLSTVVEIPARAGEVVVDIQPLQEESATAQPPEPHHEDAAASDGSTQRTLAYVAGGAGIVGIAVGSIFGLISMGKKSDAEAQCRAPDYKLCTATGVELGKDAMSAGNISTVGFVAGGVLLAGAAVLYFTAPSARSSSSSSMALVPAVGAREAGLSLHGSF